MHIAAFQTFRCIGADCTDTCCAGWRIDIDPETLERYQRSDDPELKPIFERSICLAPQASTATSASLGRNAQGVCDFLEQGLCRIHARLGHEALSPICADFPRRLNLLGNQQEFSLDLSCPEAARMILENPEPIAFLPDTPSAAFALRNPGIPVRGITTRLEEHFQSANRIRNIFLSTLQRREVLLDTRLLIAGLCVEMLESHASPLDKCKPKTLDVIEKNISQLLDNAIILERTLSGAFEDRTILALVFRDMLSSLPDHAHPPLTRLIEAACIGHWGKDHNNLQSNWMVAFDSTYHSHFAPFLAANGHMLENYLVHHVWHTGFPFRTMSPSDQFRELIANYIFIKFCLHGLSCCETKLSPKSATHFIQAFSRHTQHVPGYLESVIQVLKQNHLSTIRDLFLLLMPPPNAGAA